MMMFLLGVLVTWVVLSFLYVVCDGWCDYNIIDRTIGLPCYLIGWVFEFIDDCFRVLKVLDLCIIYHIPIFKRMQFSLLIERLDEKGKEKWVQRMPKEQQDRWRKALGMLEENK